MNDQHGHHARIISECCLCLPMTALCVHGWLLRLKGLCQRIRPGFSFICMGQFGHDINWSWEWMRPCHAQTAKFHFSGTICSKMVESADEHQSNVLRCVPGDLRGSPPHCPRPVSNLPPRHQHSTMAPTLLTMAFGPMGSDYK
jgi:hypothetical protein